MNENLKKRLEEAGVDLESTIRRFMGNEQIYMKFLKKVKDDPNYARLSEQLEQRNYAEAFKAAHTLKGVSANLGLDPICKPVSEITELLRGKADEEVDLAAVEEKKKELDEAYALIMQVIEENM